MDRRIATLALLLALAPGVLAEDSEPWELSEVLAVGPVARHGRSPVHLDPLEARLVAGTWAPPKAGDTLAGKSWTYLRADAKGWFKDNKLVGGYAYASLTLEHRRTLVLEASGHSRVYVNGEPRVGDPYRTGYVRLPVRLRAGLNEFLFACGRGALRARLVEPRTAFMLNTDDVTLPDPVVGETGEALGTVVILNAKEPVPWYFTLHGEEVGHDLSRSLKALRSVRHLGGRGVRFDIHWYEIEPERGRWDEVKLTFYTSLVSQARHLDLDPLVVLGGAPGWARDLYRDDPADFWRGYEDYVTRVLAWVRDRVQRYQLWNEANHPVWSFVRSGDQWQLFSRAGRIVKRMDPGAETVINVLADFPGWERALTGWVEKAGDVIDVVGVDHYPGTWSWRPVTEWAPLQTLLRRARTEGDALFGKRVAVVETGCSSWPRPVVGESGQRRWVRRALPALRKIVSEANARDPGRVALLGYYQLMDAKGRPAQEGSFGVLRADGSPKPAAEALREEILRFR